MYRYFLLLLFLHLFLYPLNCYDFQCILHVFLSGLNEVDAESIKELKSVTGLLMLLQEHKLFTQTDVIFMQYLLKRAGCQKLYEKCIHYARQQRALCFFEKSPGNICYALDCLRKHHSYNL